MTKFAHNTFLKLIVMKQIKSLIVIALLLMGVAGHAAAQEIARLDSYGILMENDTVPQYAKRPLLKTIVCATSPSIASAKTSILEVKDCGNFIVALLEVAYDKNEERPSLTEKYVVTCNQKQGILDGVLAVVTSDLNFAEGILPEGSEVYDKGASVKLDDKGFSVARNYETHIETGRGGPILSESGTWTKRYDIDSNGVITPNDAASTQYSRVVNRPNPSIPGRRHDINDTKVNESDKCSTLGPGAMAINIYGGKRGNVKSIESLESLLKTAIDAKPSRDHYNSAQVFAQLKFYLTFWQKGLMCRDTELWLSWLKENNQSQLFDTLHENLKSDNAFCIWLKGEVKKQKDKKLRKWWNAQFSAWSL